MRRFLPMGTGVAQMFYGRSAYWVEWRPLRFLGMYTGFYREDGEQLWKFCFRGRRIF